MFWLHSPAAPCRLFPGISLSVGYYLCPDDLVQKYCICTVRLEYTKESAFVQIGGDCLRTRAEEYNSFEVGIFIRVWGKLGHAVTELLHPPNVLHHYFSSLWGQLLCETKKKKKKTQCNRHAIKVNKTDLDRARN